MGDISQVTNGVTSIVSGIQQLGVEIPEEMSKVLGAINIISGILTTIASLATIVAVTSTTKSVPLIGWLLAGGGIVPAFANGGLIGKAAGGMMIPGNSYSGDNLRMPVDGGRGWIGVNSGELILNRSQQNNLANALEGGNNNNVENRQPYVNGELIYLGLNNYLKRTGRGEIVVSKR